MNKIKLNVLGISYSQTQSGAYALVLNEENGERRIPIIIGGFEAQSIAIQLEGLTPPRPLTHDLFLSFANAFGITITEVLIHKLEEGVFHSKLICSNGHNEISIDARTSDAVSLALRFKCPIFTTEDIMSRAGIVMNIEDEKAEEEKDDTTSLADTLPKKKKHAEDYSEYADNDLKNMLTEAVSNEDYEKASLIRDELKKRGKE